MLRPAPEGPPRAPLLVLAIVVALGLGLLVAVHASVAEGGAPRGPPPPETAAQPAAARAG